MSSVGITINSIVLKKNLPKFSLQDVQAIDGIVESNT